jgi:hypothetical protein
MLDALWIARYIGQHPVTINYGAADLNGDGAVNAADLVRFVRWFADHFGVHTLECLFENGLPPENPHDPYCDCQ